MKHEINMILLLTGCKIENNSSKGEWQFALTVFSPNSKKTKY